MKPTTYKRARPIIFSAAMVREILAGRKTQTRRVIKPQRTSGPAQIEDLVGTPDAIAAFIRHKCPYGQPGDRLWVRETWRPAWFASNHLSGPAVRYRADNRILGRLESPSNGIEEKGWKPSIFMPKWASRITLEVTDVRVERLLEMTEDDAIAEGVPKEDVCPGGDSENFHPPGAYGYVSGVHPFPKGEIYPKARGAFHELWDSINAKRGFGWDKNPWVWTVKFQRLEES